ncbi:hypothetical protein GYA28_03630 [Candidatus Roizmanbacteria bacterium]|jgi:hypothetical protein|nr:hypothetical protein [Candidatus Roizmanbacteria bacterium]
MLHELGQSEALADLTPLIPIILLGLVRIKADPGYYLELLSGGKTGKTKDKKNSRTLTVASGETAQIALMEKGSLQTVFTVDDQNYQNQAVIYSQLDKEVIRLTKQNPRANVFDSVSLRLSSRGKTSRR